MQEPLTAGVAAGQAVARAHAAEVSTGDRYEFGKNWRAFLENVDETVIGEAVRSLQVSLGRSTLTGLRFLDIGSGSGLSSLAAHRLGASVTSFDYDSDSVQCTLELRRRFGGDDQSWTITQGSVLSAEFMQSLGSYDIVYSWGVLHHTGAMWEAIDHAVARVERAGTLFIAIYIDQGAWSKRWVRIKRFYCSGPVGKWVVSSFFIPFWIVRGFLADVVLLRNPVARYTAYGKRRGMSVVRDWHDWLGGYPFEVARPEAIVLPIQRRGFSLVNMDTTNACQEYVFERRDSAVGPTT